MEKKKTVFGDIKNMLTRDQMKQVKGGSADIGGGGGGRCDSWRYSDVITCLNCCLTVNGPNYCNTVC